MMAADIFYVFRLARVFEKLRLLAESRRSDQPRRAFQRVDLDRVVLPVFLRIIVLDRVRRFVQGLAEDFEQQQIGVDVAAVFHAKGQIDPVLPTKRRENFGNHRLRRCHAVLFPTAHHPDFFFRQIGKQHFLQLHGVDGLRQVVVKSRLDILLPGAGDGVGGQADRRRFRIRAVLLFP